MEQQLLTSPDQAAGGPALPLPDLRLARAEESAGLGKKFSAQHCRNNFSSFRKTVCLDNISLKWTR